MKAIFFALLMLPLVVAAELTFPVDPSGQWVLIDTSAVNPETGQCETVGPVPRAFPGPTNPEGTEGYDPNYGPNFKLLRYVDAGPQPNYDSDRRRLIQPYIQCGPATDTCYDTTTVHADGVGCSQTDAMQQVNIVVDLPTKQVKQNLANRATLAIDSHWDEADYRRDIALLVRGLTIKAKNLSLPTTPFDFNGACEGAVSRLGGAVDANVTRYFNLLERINAGTIQDGEIETGWTVAVPDEE